MAILQALLAALMRSMGSILNTAFGWATLMLFGRIPRNHQTALSVISFGSVLWIIALLGAIHPPIASFLLIFVTIPEAALPWVRAALTVLALVLPLIVGAVALRLDATSAPRTAAAWARGVLRGYPYTIGFALTLVILTVLVPLAKLRDVLRGWTTTHIPMIVRAEDYATVVDTLHGALRVRGLPTTRGKASLMLRVPLRILSLFARSGIDSLVARQMTTLRAHDLEILLHPSDLLIRGRPAESARASAILLDTLIHTPAHLTWEKEANHLEDRLRSILQETIPPGRSAASLLHDLRTVERDLSRTSLPYEELEKVFRIKLQIETEVMHAARATVA